RTSCATTRRTASARRRCSARTATGWLAVAHCRSSHCSIDMSCSEQQFKDRVGVQRDACLQVENAMRTDHIYTAKASQGLGSPLGGIGSPLGGLGGGLG